MSVENLDWLEVTVLLLSFTLAVFVLLVFGVRVLMVVRKLPVPVDPMDMAKPKGFRGLMLGSAGLLAPLVASGLVPAAGGDWPRELMIPYVLELLVLGALWVLLDLFYRMRDRRSGLRR